MTLVETLALWRQTAKPRQRNGDAKWAAARQAGVRRNAAVLQHNLCRAGDVSTWRRWLADGQAAALISGAAVALG